MAAIMSGRAHPGTSIVASEGAANRSGVPPTVVGSGGRRYAPGAGTTDAEASRAAVPRARFAHGRRAGRGRGRRRVGALAAVMRLSSTAASGGRPFVGGGGVR